MIADTVTLGLLGAGFVGQTHSSQGCAIGRVSPTSRRGGFDRVVVKIGSCSGPPWTLRLSQFCVQGNRVRLKRDYEERRVPQTCHAHNSGAAARRRVIADTVTLGLLGAGFVGQTHSSQGCAIGRVSPTSRRGGFDRVVVGAGRSIFRVAMAGPSLRILPRN